MTYATILADPPWRFKNYSMKEKAVRGEEWARRNGRSPYDSMDTEEIGRIPVGSIAAKDCVLLLWATNPKLEDAFHVVNAWGFQYKSKLTWVKMTRAAAPRVGLGYRARACTEDLLICTRGKPPAPKPENRPMGVVFCPIGEHSRKPDFQYDLAEQCHVGPYCELFARPRGESLFGEREGWTQAGFEMSGLDIFDEIKELAAR